MNENMRTEENAADKAKLIHDTEKQLDMISKGTMKLMNPIRAAGQDIHEICWDFRKLTGWEYTDALDCDNAGVNVFKITNKQALSLFAAAAAKATVIRNEGGMDIHPLDARDIRERLSIDDTIKAVQTATVFFITSARVGNKRISNG